MKVHQAAVARWLMRANLWCGLLSGLALLLMMIVGALDVIGTNLDLLGLTSFPLPAAFEFMATLMVVNVFLAMSLAQARNGHIRVEVMVNRLPPWGQSAANALRHSLSAVLFGLIAWFGWKAGIHSTSVGEYAPGLINYPVWPARLVLGLGASLMFIQCMFDLLAVFWPALSPSLLSPKPEAVESGHQPPTVTPTTITPTTVTPATGEAPPSDRH